MPIAKVDARSFNYAKQIDWFLRPPSSSSSRPSRHSMSPPPDSPDGGTPASPVHHHPPPLRSSSSSQLLIETETQLWKDLTSSQDAVTRYINKYIYIYIYNHVMYMCAVHVLYDTCSKGYFSCIFPDLFHFFISHYRSCVCVIIFSACHFIISRVHFECCKV